MQLRTRIAVTFLALLAAVLAAALGVVSIANNDNAEREVQRQLDVGKRVFLRVIESNQHQLAQAAQAVAADYAVRQAVAVGDTETLESVLENSRNRVGATMAVLASLDGRVIADSGSQAPVGAPFQFPELLNGSRSREGNALVAAEQGRIYQLVAVAVRSPLPVAWIVMGFELDHKAAAELSGITGLGVTLSIGSADHWKDVVTTASTVPGRSDPSDLAVRQIELATKNGRGVMITLSRSLSDARVPFERLTRVLFFIALASLVGAGFAIVGLARNITRPLRALTSAVDKIRSGAYDVQVPVQRRDELGVLAEGLQVMQTAVQSRDSSIRRLAYEDTLTGLMNRTAFSAALAQQLAGSEPVGVAVLNLQRFRRVNEHLGFSTGNAVLVRVAERLRDPHGAPLAVARLGADEFAAFAVLRDAAELQNWGAALLARLLDPIVVDRQPIDISATLGLSVAPVDATGADALLRCAELAMERGRKDKQPVFAYMSALQPTARDQLSLLGELQRAIDHDDLRLYFQPKMELATNRVAGAEVLLRWQHPARGLLGPAHFLPFAEQTGFIRKITQWLLRHALAQSADWHRSGKALPLAVNISADDLADVQFDQRVADALARGQFPGHLLTLEITESGFIEDPQRALQMLEALATLGVRLSIDDFGTGYSSLSHLARMPVHEVKIDRSFVLGLETDREYAAIVRAAIDMGHSLGLKVVAEGIETQQAAADLRAMGCDIAQGYLYAKPMPLADLEAWLIGRERVPVCAAPAAAFPQEPSAEPISA
jgi:diguanylate cyclase (GGDEF)-like protein